MITKVAYRIIAKTVSLAFGAITHPTRSITDSGTGGPDRYSSAKKALLEALITQISKTDGPAYLLEIYKRRAENFELFQALHSYHLRQELELQDRIRTLVQKWYKRISPSDKGYAQHDYTGNAHDLQQIQDVIKLLEHKVHNRRYLRNKVGADGRSKRLKLPDDFHGTKEVNALLFEGWEIELREMKTLGALLEQGI